MGKARVMINDSNLASYLNDHLAGSVAALTLLDHLVSSLEGTPHAYFFEALRDDITADQSALKALLDQVGKESRLRMAAGWVTEKFAEMKVRMDGDKFGDLGLLEALEILAIGITGKRMLWAALRSILNASPLLSDADLAYMEQRAIMQLERVESARLASAKAAFLVAPAE